MKKWDVRTSHAKHVNFGGKKNTQLVQKHVVLDLACTNHFENLKCIIDFFCNTSTLKRQEIPWLGGKLRSELLQVWRMAVVINEDSELLSQGVNLKSDTAVIESVMILSFQKLWAQRACVHHFRITVAGRLGTGSCQLSLALSRGCLVTHQLALCCCFFLKIAQKSQVGQTSP